MAPPEIGLPRVQETEREVASNYYPIKANLSNNPSLKEILDESVAEIVTRKGYPEDLKLRIVTSSLATITIAIGLCAQFYDMKLPENRKILVGCVGLFIVSIVILQLITFLFENKRILSTHPPPDCFFSTGLVVTSVLPKYSDKYTLIIESADPQSIAANPSVQFTKSVTKWFTNDGTLVEGLFWKDVEGLMRSYTNESKKR